MDFSELGLHPDLLDGIDALNFTKATPIQEQSIPLILQGKDLIGVAQTGTGKTAAFVLPILNMILESNESSHIQALIVVPTRELATQIDQVIEAYSYFTGVSSIAIYGGSDGKAFDREKTAIVKGVDIVIATPGRLLAHMKLGYVNFKRLNHLVLDEADRMLDMGFLPDLQRIIESLNPNRQSLLFSATMPSQVLRLANTLLKNPEMVKIALSKPAEGVTQLAYLVPNQHKLALVTELLQDKIGQRILVFGSTKISVSALYKQLKTRKLNVGQISSDVDQTQREQVMQDFRNRKVDILVATDVVSRGIDVDGIDIVINFDVPREPEDYVHRIGRTARAERKGTAITLVAPSDLVDFGRIEKMVGKEVEKVPLPDSIRNRKESAPPARNHHSKDKKSARPIVPAKHFNKTKEVKSEVPSEKAVAVDGEPTKPKSKRRKRPKKKTQTPAPPAEN